MSFSPLFVFSSSVHIFYFYTSVRCDLLAVFLEGNLTADWALLWFWVVLIFLRYPLGYRLLQLTWPHQVGLLGPHGGESSLWSWIQDCVSSQLLPIISSHDLQVVKIRLPPLPPTLKCLPSLAEISPSSNSLLLHGLRLRNKTWEVLFWISHRQGSPVQSLLLTWMQEEKMNNISKLNGHTWCLVSGLFSSWVWTITSDFHNTTWIWRVPGRPSFHHLVKKDGRMYMDLEPKVRAWILPLLLNCHGR